MPPRRRARDRVRDDLRLALINKFLSDPDLALALWETMGWELPVALSKRKEQRQAEKRRLIAEAIDLAQRAVAAFRQAPLSGPTPVEQFHRYLGQKSRENPTRNYTGLRRGLMAFPTDPSVLEEALRDEFLADRSFAADLWQNTDWPPPESFAMQREREQISRRRAEALAGCGDLYNKGLDAAEIPEILELAYQAVDAGDFAMHQEVVGLAFSGGGIRSATFNLGVLHGLAESSVLKRVDYLSTVSGGGYIGGWLAGWVKRLKWPQVETLLSPDRSPDPQAKPLKPVRFLRQYSNYLTPSLGAFSTDTWAMGAVWVRNLILNQATLITCIGAVLLLPRLWELLLVRNDYGLNLLRLEGIWPALLCLFAAAAYISWNLSVATATCTPGVKKDGQPPRTGPGWVWAAVAGVVVFAILANAWFWISIDWLHSIDVSWRGWCGGAGTTDFWGSFWGVAWIVIFLLSVQLSAFGGFRTCFRNRLSGNDPWLARGLILLIAILTSCTALGLVRGYVEIIYFLHSHAREGGPWHATILGPPLVLGIISLAGVLQIGLMGIDFPDPGREWLSRFRALTNIFTFFWLAFFGAAIYGPWLFAWSGTNYRVWEAAIGTGWIATTISSLIAANSGRTGQTKEGAPAPSRVDMIAKVGPPVFLVGFILVISIAEHLLLSAKLLSKINGAGLSFSNLNALHWQLMDQAPVLLASEWPLMTVVWLFAGLAVAGVILLWRVDINEFSMHHFYKNRLVRAYLGASHPNRKPNLFTAFDAHDDFHLTSLKPTGSYTGPYPIINTTLNLSAGGQLAWQERQAASFVFTPCFSGYDLAEDSDHIGPRPGTTDLKFCAFRETDKYGYMGGIHTGTAMAISGAAASPNQGFHTSTAVAFLMTVFDVRLGWWMGNPRRDAASRLASPRFGLKTLIDEMLGLTDDRAEFVSLSDGGHFDNMGIYELVKRRAKYIVLCDAEQDGAYTFGGLGMAIRRCRVDFGAEIDIDPQRIAPSQETHFSASHCVTGTIRYVDGSVGMLVYLKSSLTGDEPEDVLEYKSGQPGFPHESTADQWFGESQFESYRKLGYHATQKSFQPAINQARALNQALTDSDLTNSSVFSHLAKVWYPTNAAVQKYASKHTKTYNELMDLLRTTKSLHSLGDQLFPETKLPLAQIEGDPRDRFYFCLALIQLLEDVYSDFGLDSSLRKNDPRIGGWMSLYRGWKKVPVIADTWSAIHSTYREDFQAFWNQLES